MLSLKMNFAMYVPTSNETHKQNSNAPFYLAHKSKVKTCSIVHDGLTRLFRVCLKRFRGICAFTIHSLAVIKLFKYCIVNDIVVPCMLHGCSK